MWDFCMDDTDTQPVLSTCLVIVRGNKWFEWNKNMIPVYRDPQKLPANNSWK